MKFYERLLGNSSGSGPRDKLLSIESIISATDMNNIQVEIVKITDSE